MGEGVAMAEIGRGENERWVGVFLDLPGDWWKREKQDDLFVRLPGVEQIVGSGVGRAWAVFVRPIDQHSDDANALNSRQRAFSLAPVSADLSAQPSTMAIPGAGSSRFGVSFRSRISPTVSKRAI
jgi:hypothetical protein